MLKGTTAAPVFRCLFRLSRPLPARTAPTKPQPPLTPLPRLVGCASQKAQALLGQMLIEGYGCEADPARGREWAEKARRRGYRMDGALSGTTVECPQQRTFELAMTSMLSCCDAHTCAHRQSAMRAAPRPNANPSLPCRRVLQDLGRPEPACVCRQLGAPQAQL